MMKKIVRTLALCIVAVPVLAYAGQTTSSKEPIVLGTSDLKGFEKCEGNEKLESIINGIFEHPTTKKDYAWIYKVSGEYFGLPIKELVIGICDDTGERGCGWASYFGLVLSGQVEDVRARLLEKTGVDFTIEKRDEDTRRTLRPILERRRDNRNESLLVCDPGDL